MSIHRTRSSRSRTNADPRRRRPHPLRPLAIAAILAGTPALAGASTPLGNQTQVNTTIGSAQQQPEVAADGSGNFVVVWESYSSSGSDTDTRSVQARRYTAAGAPAGPEFQVNTSTANSQKAPAVAMNANGAFVVVWESDHGQFTDFDIMAQRYTPTGAKAGPELLVNSGHTAGVQGEPAVAMADNGDFVVVWTSPGGAGSDPDGSIQGRRWRAATGTFFDQILVNDVTAGDQVEPAIATNGTGRYLAVWTHPATSNDIALRGFTVDNPSPGGLVAAGPQETVNTFPTGSQTAPAIAVNPDGSGIVAWESFGASFGNDNQRISVQARRFDPDVEFLDGNDVQVNTYITDDQRFPAVAIAPNGVTAVAWQSYGSSGNDASDYSVQLRAFAADGAPLDPADVQANTFTSNAQTAAGVALAPTGRLLAVWESNGSPGDDNNGFSIQGRLFKVFDPPSRAIAIPAAARVQGSGAFFTSRVDLLHTGSVAREVRVTYTPRADLGGAVQTAVVPLPANTQLSVTDPLAAWFGFSGSTPAVGSLLLELTAVGGGPATGDLLLAQSVVFARNPDDTEYGQFFPALAEDDALAAGETGYLATTVDAEVYRVNVGLMALADGTSVTVTPQDRIGTALAPGQTFTLDRGGNRQLNNIFRVFNLAPQDNIVVAVRVTSGLALAYSSVLDGNLVYPGTSDPTTILPVTGGAPQVTLLELGPITGLNEFSGSASVTNFSTGQAAVRADFFARGAPGVADTATFTIPAGDTVGFDDMVGDLFGLQGVGTVRLTTTNSTRISASGREFAIFRDGQGVVNGTAGQAIPGLLPADLVDPGVVYHLLGLREVSNAAGRERSHLAAFNPGSAPLTLAVEVIDGATGRSEGTTDLTVRGGELIQVNSIIAVVKPGQDGQVKRIEVTATGPAYVNAFRVNKDGDPVTIPPQRGE